MEIYFHFRPDNTITIPHVTIVLLLQNLEIIDTEADDSENEERTTSIIPYIKTDDSETKFDLDNPDEPGYTHSSILYSTHSNRIVSKNPNDLRTT